MVVNGYKHAGGYDPWTGKELWKLSGGGDIPVPTPVAAHGLVFLSSAHGRKRPLCAIREGASGDITPKDDDEPGDHFAWYLPRSGIYMQTPLVYGDYLYACGDNGLLNLLRGSDRKTHLPRAARERIHRVHGVGSRGRRQALFHQRGWGHLRGPSRAGV